MRLGRVSIPLASIAVLAVQLALVGSIAVRYLYQRSNCPRVWVRTETYDPVGLLRGRYLSVQLLVNGCQSTLPSAEDIVMPRDTNGVPTGKRYTVRKGIVWPLQFSARLKVDGNRLLAIRVPESEESYVGQRVIAGPGSACDAMRLLEPVPFYLPEHAKVPAPVFPGHWDVQEYRWVSDAPNLPEIWMEVTVPPTGPPRPIQLALKQDGAWTPLAFQ